MISAVFLYKKPVYGDLSDLNPVVAIWAAHPFVTAWKESFWDSSPIFCLFYFTLPVNVNSLI